jgi:hypothetical protein
VSNADDLFRTRSVAEPDQWQNPITAMKQARNTIILLAILLATAAAQAVDRITIDQLHRKMQRREKIIIIDARDGNAYIGSTVRIPGAIHLTLREIELRLHEIPRGREIIVYCT